MKNMPQESTDARALQELVNYDKLQSLSDYDDEILRELMSITLQTNQQDLAQAADLFQLQDWPELAKSIHSISGAAQIFGAEGVKTVSRSMELACREVPADDVKISRLWQSVIDAVTELNSAIERWLHERK